MNAYTRQDLSVMQAWPLERKIRVTQAKIIEWYHHYGGKVAVSFSGGKDSTVLLDLARRAFPDIPAVFVDTGLEYPEIREFVKTVPNVTWLRPEMPFSKVISEYGYPVVSKDVARRIRYARKGSTWALCRMNMFLHSFDSARVEWCDTLNSPLLVENDRLMKFNCVVANPPFSLDKWGAENAESDQYNRFWRGVPPKSKGDWAFISHMVEIALEKQGRVAVVVPHGVLFRGAAEGRIRQKMIEENLLDAVIGLPGNLFPTTNIPVAILVFDRSREKGGVREDCKNVFFVDASREFVSSKNQNTLSETHLAKIMETYTARAEEEKYAHMAEYAEIKENDFNLNIPRYVDTFEEEEEVDIGAVQVEIEALEKELAAVRMKMAEKLKEIQR